MHVCLILEFYLRKSLHFIDYISKYPRVEFITKHGPLGFLQLLTAKSRRQAGSWPLMLNGSLVASPRSFSQSPKKLWFFDEHKGPSLLQAKWSIRRKQRVARAKELPLSQLGGEGGSWSWMIIRNSHVTASDQAQHLQIQTCVLDMETVGRPSAGPVSSRQLPFTFSANQSTPGDSRHSENNSG